MTYYLYTDIINLIELLKGVTALENRYLTKQVVLRAVILFIAFIGIKLILSRIIPGIFDAFFYTIPFLLVVIPVFYKQIGIKKAIAYSALSMVLIPVFVYIINLDVLILLGFTFDLMFISDYSVELTGTLLQTAALFLSLLISFKLITRSSNIKIRFNFLTLIILAVYIISYYILSYLSRTAFRGSFLCEIREQAMYYEKMLLLLNSCSNILTSLFIFSTSLHLIKSAVIKEE